MDRQSKARDMDGDDVKYLRDKAVHFRELAATYRTDLVDALLRLADEFEQKAAEIAARSGTRLG